MLAGYGMFLMEAVLPRVSQRERMLGIARMSVTWNPDDLITQAERLGYRADPQVAARIRQQSGYFTSREFFELLGFASYEDIDFDGADGATIKHDLNTPVPVELHERYDFLFENGTIEHIFDLKTAMGSLAQMVKVGGTVSHGSPLDAFNHGFYNFSINLFHDFYRANGFTDFEFFLVRYAANWHADQNVEVERLEYTHEEFYVNPESYTKPLNKMYIATVARKERHVPVTQVPIQAAYDPALGLDSRLVR